METARFAPGRELPAETDGRAQGRGGSANGGSVAAMRIRLEQAALAAALAAVPGCCGGYSVVRTTFVDRAEMRADDLGTVREGDAFVLHFARLGEPPNDCGSSANYVEDLYIRVPSIGPGEVHTIDRNGVLASYERAIDGMERGARSIEGTVAIRGREGSDLAAHLNVTIRLSGGERVVIDDVYAFHPRKAR